MHAIVFATYPSITNISCVKMCNFFFNLIKVVVIRDCSFPVYTDHKERCLCMQMQNQNTPLWNIRKHSFTFLLCCKPAPFLLLFPPLISLLFEDFLGLLPHLWLVSVFIHFFMAARIFFFLNTEDKIGTSVFMDDEKNYKRDKPLPCLEYIFSE